MCKHRMICATVMISNGVYGTSRPFLHQLTHNTSTHNTRTKERELCKYPQPFAAPKICWYAHQWQRCDTFVDLVNLSIWNSPNGNGKMGWEVHGCFAHKMLLIWEFIFLCFSVEIWHRFFVLSFNKIWATTKTRNENLEQQRTHDWRSSIFNIASTSVRSSLRVDILTATVQGTINAVKSTSSLSVKYWNIWRLKSQNNKIYTACHPE